MNSKKAAVLASGRGSNLQALLEALPHAYNLELFPTLEQAPNP